MAIELKVTYVDGSAGKISGTTGDSLSNKISQQLADLTAAIRDLKKTVGANSTASGTSKATLSANKPTETAKPSVSTMYVDRAGNVAPNLQPNLNKFKQTFDEIGDKFKNKFNAFNSITGIAAMAGYAANQLMAINAKYAVDVRSANAADLGSLYVSNLQSNYSALGTAASIGLPILGAALLAPFGLAPLGLALGTAAGAGVSAATSSASASVSQRNKIQQEGIAAFLSSSNSVGGQSDRNGYKIANSGVANLFNSGHGYEIPTYISAIQGESRYGDMGLAIRNSLMHNVASASLATGMDMSALAQPLSYLNMRAGRDVSGNFFSALRQTGQFYNSQNVMDQIMSAVQLTGMSPTSAMQRYIDTSRYGDAYQGTANNLMTMGVFQKMGTDMVLNAFAKGSSVDKLAAADPTAIKAVRDAAKGNMYVEGVLQSQLGVQNELSIENAQTAKGNTPLGNLSGDQLRSILSDAVKNGLRDAMSESIGNGKLTINNGTIYIQNGKSDTKMNYWVSG